MSETKIETPKAIHHSHQFQQQDLGETIRLYAGEGPDGPVMVGTIYNVDDMPCVEDEQAEEFEAQALAIADKVVRAYNCHDDLLAVLKRLAPTTCPIVTHHRPDCDFCAALKVIARAEGAAK